MMTQGALSGRVALVTGAASGIGLATAVALAEAGAHVLLVDRDAEALGVAASRIPGSRAHVADLSNEADFEALGREAEGADVLVNCAGLQVVSPLEALDDATWHRMISVLLTAPFRLMRSALPGMYRRGWGRIVNVGSVHSLVASPYKAAYVAAKHGLAGLTKVVALEAAARCPDVTAHVVCPSYVRTPLVEKQIAAQATLHGRSEDDIVADVLLARNAIKRLLEPEDVARAVLWLCDKGAWPLTGGALVLDGGWLAH